MCVLMCVCERGPSPDDDDTELSPMLDWRSLRTRENLRECRIQPERQGGLPGGGDVALRPRVGGGMRWDGLGKGIPGSVNSIGKRHGG